MRLIVGFPAGGAADVTARLISQWLSEQLGQAFVVENRPGAGTNIGTEAVVKAPAGRLYAAADQRGQYRQCHPLRAAEFQFHAGCGAGCGLIRGPLVMVLHPSVPAKTLPEFIAYARAHLGTINMGSAGNGTPGHMSGELFKMATGLDLVHVPYRGGAPALTDLVAGQVQVMFDNLPTSIEHIRAGRLRALAVTTAVRSQLLPELPTVSEFVPGYEVSSWFAIGAPRTTSPTIIEKLNAEVGAALADPRLQARIAELSSTPLPLSPQELATLVATETEKWARVIKFSGAKAE